MRGTPKSSLPKSDFPSKKSTHFGGSFVRFHRFWNGQWWVVAKSLLAWMVSYKVVPQFVSSLTWLIFVQYLGLIRGIYRTSFHGDYKPTDITWGAPPCRDFLMFIQLPDFGQFFSVEGPEGPSDIPMLRWSHPLWCLLTKKKTMKTARWCPPSYVCWFIIPIN